MKPSPLLVVAGEASGDRAASAVVRALEERPSCGFGGQALRTAGTELVADLRATTAMGLSIPLARAARLARVYRELVALAKDRKPRVALLVNYTEFNLRLAASLRPLGVRIVWYGAPQIWAWRAGRARVLRGLVDRLCVMLPFEEPLWQGLGVDATYVGHPARETPALTRREARAVLGLTERAAALAILPGSRPHEVRAMLPSMLEGYRRVRSDRASVDARVFLAPSLDEPTLAWGRKLAAGAELGVVEVDATAGIGRVLPAFDAALTASGTASLECALAGAVPVVAYRVSLLTELGARLLVDTPHIALPNVLLRRRAFAELLQRDVTPKKIARAIAHALDDERGRSACSDVLRELGTETSPSQRVAQILTPWLDA